jgi:hypothetical protein
VLPQQRIAPVGHVEEVGPEEAIEHQQELGCGQHRNGEEQQELRHQGHPGEDRHAHQAHARAAHVEHGDDQVDGTGQRGDTGDDQTQVPEVDAMARREENARVRCVHEPPAVGPTAEQPTGLEEEATTEEAPEAEGVDAGEGDVARPDLQGHQEVGERGTDRHHHQEHHRGAVHGEHLVVELGREQRATRRPQLGPDEQRLGPADDEEEHGGGAVHDADLLVIDGEQPTAPRGLGRDRPRQHAEWLEVVGLATRVQGEGAGFNQCHVRAP